MVIELEDAAARPAAGAWRQDGQDTRRDIDGARQADAAAADPLCDRFVFDCVLIVMVGW